MATAPLHLARALAMALLADSYTAANARASHALAARARQCIGHERIRAASGSTTHSADALPDSFLEQLRRLSLLPAREWQRLQIEDLATWLTEGRWWRQAGLPASAGRAEAGAGITDDFDLDDPDFLYDEDDEGDESEASLPVLPLARQSNAQLAQAFCQWAAQPSVQVRRWVLRTAQPGPQPAWMDGRTLGSRAAPRWATAADLAHALDLEVDELLWLAPAHTHWREAAGHALPPSHYRYRLLPKRSGGLRLLEIARPRLAHAQRRLLDLALAPIPAHEAAHGFVRGRNVASHVAPHAGQAVVMRFDLQDFFTQVHATRVRALWRALGHSRAVADLLTCLTTARTPAAVRERLLEPAPQADQTDPQHSIAARRLRAQALARAHLPQGAPTSPAIANLCAFGMDVRLAALADRFGARYSRYADDLVFSGQQDRHRQWPNLRAWVGAIVRAEGFALNADKTRCMAAHQRQQVTGVVLNTRPNLAREQFDLLKARLHRLGQQPSVPLPERARLLGQLQWARQWLAPTRAAKLQSLLEAIRFAR